MKNNYLKSLTAIILIIIISLFGFILIIPGIILLLSYQFTLYVIMDDNDLNIISSLKESRYLMKKQHINYLIFILSFIGLKLLSILTLEILNFWLTPYIQVSKGIYYEKRKR